MVEVDDAKMANMLIEEGLVLDHTLHGCIRYNPACKIKQSFKCYEYSQVSVHYQKNTRRGACSGPHRTSNALEIGNKSAFCVMVHIRLGTENVNTGKNSTNQVSEVMRRFRLAKPPTMLKTFFIPLPFYQFLIKRYHPSKPKTLRRKHSVETVAVILALHNLGKSLVQISDHVKVPRATVGHTIHRATRAPDQQLRPNKRAGRPPKPDARARRALIRYVERNPHDTFIDCF